MYLMLLQGVHAGVVKTERKQLGLPLNGLLKEGQNKWE